MLNLPASNLLLLRRGCFAGGANRVSRVGGCRGLTDACAILTCFSSRRVSYTPVLQTSRCPAEWKSRLQVLLRSLICFVLRTKVMQVSARPKPPLPAHHLVRWTSSALQCILSTPLRLRNHSSRRVHVDMSPLTSWQSSMHTPAQTISRRVSRGSLGSPILRQVVGDAMAQATA